MAKYLNFGYNDLLDMDHVERIKWVEMANESIREENKRTNAMRNK